MPRPVAPPQPPNVIHCALRHHDFPAAHAGVAGITSTTPLHDRTLLLTDTFFPRGGDILCIPTVDWLVTFAAVFTREELHRQEHITLCG